MSTKPGAIQGHWVLDNACRQMRIWHDQNTAPPLIAIQLSLVQLKTGSELIFDVLRTTAHWNLCPWELRFDVTESTLAQTTWAHNDILPRLCELGVNVAIEDFGTEYSSFDYLKTYRVSHLKLAKRFLESTRSDATNALTLRAILNFASDVGIGVTAKGIETEDERFTLISTGTPMTLPPDRAIEPCQGEDELNSAIRQCQQMDSERNVGEP